MKTQARGSIPCEVIRPFIQAHIDEMEALEMGTIYVPNAGRGRGKITAANLNNDHGTDKVYDAYEALGFRSGLSGSIVRKICDGNKETITFKTADKILSRGMHNFMLWHEPELAPYYWQGEVPPDYSRPVKHGDEWVEVELVEELMAQVKVAA